MATHSVFIACSSTAILISIVEIEYLFALMRRSRSILQTIERCFDKLVKADELCERIQGEGEQW